MVTPNTPVALSGIIRQTIPLVSLTGPVRMLKIKQMKNPSIKIEEKKDIMVKTYVFKVEVEQEEDGRWSAEIPVLPGCATWGYTKEETLEALREGAQAYLEVLAEHNDPLPTEAEEEVRIIAGAEVVTVTL